MVLAVFTGGKKGLFVFCLWVGVWGLGFQLGFGLVCFSVDLLGLQGICV